MKLTGFAIDHHQFTIVLILLLVLSGVISFVTMPRSEDPQFSVPGATVIVIYPGASPVDLEQLVVEPVEETINELKDIKYIDSSAEDGVASVAVEFEIGTDSDEKYSDVVQKVTSIMDDLPDDILSLDIVQWSISDVSILQAAIVSETAGYRDLEREAERLEQLLKTIPGVTDVKTRAFPGEEVRVSLNPERLAETGIPLWRVVSAIRSSNADIPGGTVDMGFKSFTIQTSGDYESIEDIRNTVVQAGGGRIVYLKDIARVVFDYEDDHYHARHRGERAVFVTCAQKEGTNIFTIMDRVKRRLASFESGLPAGMKLAIVFDQTDSVSARINGFFRNFLQGVVLVGAVVLLALGVRSSLIVMLAIPFSALIAIGFVDVVGFGLQQMTIAGLVIALGLLVDNAIVVVENISRFMARGHRGREAALQGTDQIGWAIVSATATTVLAFVPLSMLRSTAGDFLRSMPVTVIFALSASLLISLTLTPYLSSFVLKTTGGAGRGLSQRLLYAFVEHRYRRVLRAALGRPGLVIILALAAFAGSLALLPVVGFSLFPKAQKAQLMIDIETPAGSSLDRTDEAARHVESVLDHRDEVLHYTANIGHGNPRLYYNVFPGYQKSTRAQVFVQLEEYDEREMAALIGELRGELDAYAGAKIEVHEFEQGPLVEAPVAIRLLGDNLQELRTAAGKVEALIKETPGTVNVNNPLRTSKTDLHLDINREKAALLGVPIVDIDRTVRAAVAGLTVSRYRDSEGGEYNIVVRLPIDERPALGDFDRIRITSVTGAQVPLRQLASIGFKAAPAEIKHYDLERNVLLTADVLGGYSIDRVTKRIIAKLERCDIPAGCRFSIAGELESRQESFAGITRAITVALISILGVLVLQFRSYRQPLIVFSAIPLAVVGSVLALLVTGKTFSFTAFIGLSSLVGIVINNSIILVDYTNRLRGGGKDIVSALQEAGETRFIPIILTTATTICGLLPLTLRGGPMWAPMGWTIIGGLLVSTLLTLIVVPVLYKISEGRGA